MRIRLDHLLDQLCTELGFCLAPAARARLADASAGSARAFADAMFVAEGLDPTTADRHLWRQVHDRVRNYINEVDAGDSAPGRQGDA